MTDMHSITFALADDEHPVPGIDALLAAVLFVMHAPAVRDWIRQQRAAARNRGLVVIADDEWVNPGGYESLTVPATQPDLWALAEIRAKATASSETGEDHG